MVKVCQQTSHLIEAVGARAKSYLQEESNISTRNISYDFYNVNNLELNYLTSIMAVEGHLDVLFAFSFDKNIAKKIMEEYTAELPSPNDNPEDYIEETVADLINIVLGNALGEFNIGGEAIRVSPPIVISGAKNIHKNKTAQFLTAELGTDFGKLQIHCIGPRELFDPQLNYIGEN